MSELLRRAINEIREDWPENRVMGMDRQQWRFHRAVANLLEDQIELHDSMVAKGVIRDHDSVSGDLQARLVAEAYLGIERKLPHE